MKIGNTAMVLAAGLGLRMRPLTFDTPKPLIRVAGKPLIEHGFDRLREAKVSNAIINVHYLPEQIRTWSETQITPNIVISDETDAILDTGGGILRALPLLGTEPFFVLNSDSFWIDRNASALQRLRDSWSDEMDCLLLLCDRKQTTGYDSDGDFLLSKTGKLSRKTPSTKNALAYIGGYLVHPRLFNDAPQGKFSMNLLWDRAIENNKLFGIVHLGHWLHVGTPEAILKAEKYLQQE